MSVEMPKELTLPCSPEDRNLWLALRSAVWAIEELLDMPGHLDPKRKAQLHRMLMMLEAEFQFGFEGRRDFGVIIPRGAKISRSEVENAYPVEEGYDLHRALVLVDRACAEQDPDFSREERDELEALAGVLNYLATRA